MRRLILYIIGIVMTAMGAHANPRYCARYVKEHCSTSGGLRPT